MLVEQKYNVNTSISHVRIPGSEHDEHDERRWVGSARNF
jgi:hypothetical protein